MLSKWKKGRFGFALLALLAASCALAQPSGMPSRPKFQQVTVGGVDVALVNQNGMASKSSAETRSATVVSNDANLVLTIPAAGWYRIRGHLLVTALTTADHGLRYRLAFSGSTGKRAQNLQTVAGSAVTQTSNLIDGDSLISALSTVATVVEFDQSLQFTSGGTLTFQWACGAGTNCGSSTRLGDNTLMTYISYERLN